MPAKHTLNFVLTEPLVRYIRDRVAAGHHPSASHLVRAGLQTLIERDQAAPRDRTRQDRSEQTGRE